MVEYARMTDDEIIHASEGMLRIRLCEAQAEIERLNEKDKLCTPAEHERMIEQRVIKALSDRMEGLCRTVVRHQDINSKHHKEAGELRGRVLKLEAPLFVDRRVEQRRADSDDRRNFSTRKCRHGGESLGRRIQDRRQP